MKLVQPMKKKFRWFRLFFMVIVVYFLYVIAGQQLEMMHIRQEERYVNNSLEEAARENKNLVAEKASLSTLPHIEKLAREMLGMVKPGEVPFIPAKNNKN